VAVFSEGSNIVNGNVQRTRLLRTTENAVAKIRRENFWKDGEEVYVHALILPPLSEREAKLPQ
jgi:hypothetical protein